MLVLHEDEKLNTHGSSPKKNTHKLTKKRAHRKKNKLRNKQLNAK